VTVVMNPPDPRIFVGRIEPQKNPSSEFNLFCHGVVAYRLGLDIAVSAMDLLRDRVPEARLRVIGAGDYLSIRLRNSSLLGASNTACRSPRSYRSRIYRRHSQPQVLE
jgi:glycosyltransferase involved in cell wall biosynthesis